MNDSGLLVRWRSWAPYFLSILRFMAALLFIEPGSAKLFAFPVAVMPGGGTAAIASLAGIAGRTRLTWRMLFESATEC